MPVWVGSLKEAGNSLGRYAPLMHALISIFFMQHYWTWNSRFFCADGSCATKTGTDGSPWKDATHTALPIVVVPADIRDGKLKIAPLAFDSGRLRGDFGANKSSTGDVASRYFSNTQHAIPRQQGHTKYCIVLAIFFAAMALPMNGRSAKWRKCNTDRQVEQRRVAALSSCTTTCKSEVFGRERTAQLLGIVSQTQTQDRRGVNEGLEYMYVNVFCTYWENP